MGKVAVATPNACDPYKRLYEPDEVQPLPYLPDRLSFRQDIADLNAQVTNVVDVMVGRIMKKLDETGFAQNTLVIFTSDHGICMPRAKGTMYDAGIEVSLIMRLPERFQAGQKVDALLSNIDLLPTLIELAGGTPPNYIDGHSFLPLLDGRDYKARDHIFFDNEWHGRYFGQRGVRSERYKYFRSFNPQGRYIITHRAGRSFRELAADVRMDHYPPIEELYDLENDPHEQHNLAPARSIHDILGARKNQPYSADPNHEEMLRQMRAILYDRMLTTSDPLLKGPIPHPAHEMLWDETLFPRA